MTGLANRIRFAERVSRCIQQSHREPDYIFGVLFPDLDRFKVINDSLGHLAGDQLLVETARRLTKTVRSSDFVGRLTASST